MRLYGIYVTLILLFPLLTTVSCMEEQPQALLVGMDVCNLDNADVNMTISDRPIKKEAYVIGVKYRLKVEGSEELQYFDPNLVDAPIIANVKDNPLIYCNNDFNEEYPAGSDITKFFTFGSRDDMGLNLILVLKKAPAVGSHSFKIRFLCTDNTVVEQNTSPVNLY